jgi:hypothetical protein
MNPDQETIIAVMEDIRERTGFIVDDQYDACPGSVPKLTAEIEDELSEIEHHLNHLFSLARSAAP